MANKPRIRFRGFTEDWEQRKLCQITTRVTRKNGDQSDLPLTISAQDGLVDQRKYFNRQVASRDMSNYYLIKKGEFAYNKSYSEGYPFGAVKRLDYYDIGALSTLYILFEITDNNISSDFIVSYYMTHLWYKEISKRAAEGARNHGLLNISTEDFFDSELNIPNSIEEQVKIGNFIKQFDKFITLHQCKLKKLNLAKKSLLQKLFPRNGSQIPGVRFKGFTDAWEQRKLDDIAKIKTGGGTPKTANPEYWSGNIPWIQSSDLAEGDIVHVNINKFINNNALKNSAAKLISRDSIALVTRVGVGKVAVINQDFTTSQDFLSLSDFDRSDIKFLAYQLYRLMQENAKVLQGTSIKGITKTELIEQSISIPSSGQEQNLISAVLSKIDSIITLHQRKLERLQEVKKGLLQKMFV